MKLLTGGTLAVLFCAAAGAVPITYSEQSTASGSFGGDPFSNMLVTITLVSDTTLVTGGPSVFFNVGTATVTVAGIGTGTFTDIMQVFDAQGVPMAGINDKTAAADVLDTTDAAFSSYALVTAIGPITDTAAINSIVAFPTTFGALDITSATTSTFDATGPVPEPASFGLLAAGLAFIAARGWLRKREAA
jgi:PEP-CTERM motif